MERVASDREVGGDSDDEYAHVSRRAGLAGLARGQKGYLQACREIFKGETSYRITLLTQKPKRQIQTFCDCALAAAYMPQQCISQKRIPLIRPEHVPVVRNLAPRNSSLATISAPG